MIRCRCEPVAGGSAALAALSRVVQLCRPRSRCQRPASPERTLPALHLVHDPWEWGITFISSEVTDPDAIRVIPTARAIRYWRRASELLEEPSTSL
jgi:hypothetical protein